MTKNELQQLLNNAVKSLAQHYLNQEEFIRKLDETRASIESLKGQITLLQTQLERFSDTFNEEAANATQEKATQEKPKEGYLTDKRAERV